MKAEAILVGILIALAIFWAVLSCLLCRAGGC